MTAPDLLRKLKEEFRSKAERPEDFFLLHAPEAEEMIRKGKKLGLRLAGVDGFHKLETGAFQPEQEFSNDSWQCGMSMEEFEASTLRLLRRGGDNGILFDVVFEHEALE